MIRSAMCLRFQKGWQNDVMTVMTVGNDQDQKKAWKNYHEKLLNTEFAWDRNSLSLADTISGIPRSIDKDMIRELISKIKN